MLDEFESKGCMEIACAFKAHAIASCLFHCVFEFPKVPHTKFGNNWALRLCVIGNSARVL